MEYVQLTVTAFLLQDIHFSQANEIISDTINKAMLMDDELAARHKEKGYKYYVFNSLYPLEPDKIYKKGRVYVFNIRSLDSIFINSLRLLLPQVEDVRIKIISCSGKRIRQRHIAELYTMTPVIVTIDGKPWTEKGDLLLLHQRLQANLEKKYKDFYHTTLTPVNNLIQRIQILNKKPIACSYKGIKLLGSKFKIWLNDDEISQKLGFIAVACGLGEKNSSIGAGFCEWR